MHTFTHTHIHALIHKNTHTRELSHTFLEVTPRFSCTDVASHTDPLCIRTPGQCHRHVMSNTSTPFTTLRLLHVVLECDAFPWTHVSCPLIGRLQFASGNVYEGEFQNNKMHGQGTYQWVDGSSYKGLLGKNYSPELHSMDCICCVCCKGALILLFFTPFALLGPLSQVHGVRTPWMAWEPSLMQRGKSGMCLSRPPCDVSPPSSFPTLESGVTASDVHSYVPFMCDCTVFCVCIITPYAGSLTQKFAMNPPVLPPPPILVQARRVPQ